MHLVKKKYLIFNFISLMNQRLCNSRENIRETYLESLIGSLLARELFVSIININFENT